MKRSTLLPLQGVNNKQFIRTLRALPWAIGRLAFQAVILAVCLSSCTPTLMKNITKQLPPLDDSAEVTVYDMGDTVPEHSEIIGGVSFAYTCNFENIMKVVKKTAREAGGNGLEVQFHAYNAHAQQIAAFILNVNDSIQPTEPTTLEKKNFNDYVVMNEGDTIPCSIILDAKGLLQFVHGYNRQGYKKAMMLPKNELLSYYIADPSAFKEGMDKKNKLFSMRFALDGGYSYGFYHNDHDYRGFTGSIDIRFQVKNGFTFGAYYGYYPNKGRYWGSNIANSEQTLFTQQTTHFIAGSFGRVLSALSRRGTLDFYLNGGSEVKPSMTKYRISFNILIGYLSYYEEGTIGTYHTLSGNTMGFGGYYGLEYMVSERLGLGLQYGFTIGIPFKAKVEGNAFYQSGIEVFPNQFDFTAGLRYYL